MPPASKPVKASGDPESPELAPLPPEPPDDPACSLFGSPALAAESFELKLDVLRESPFPETSAGSWAKAVAGRAKRPVTATVESARFIGLLPWICVWVQFSESPEPTLSTTVLVEGRLKCKSLA
jgi:hypothetical protein